jgi:hypothetical protein
MGDFTDFFRRHVWAQIVALVAFVAFVLSVVNDSVAFFAAPWLPSWVPGVLAAALFYAAFVGLSYRLDRTVQDLKGEVEAVKANRLPVILMDPEPREERLDTGPGGTPNISLRRAVQTVLSSRWADDHQATESRVLVEIRDKLQLRRLTAFGRQEPGGGIAAIPSAHWAGYSLDPQSGNAVIGDQIGYFDVQLDENYVDALWPAY